MPTLYPMRFAPLLKQYLWGGRRLGSLFGKPIGDGDDYAESWELVDHDDGQSVVADGPLAGATLGELVRDHREELFGRHSVAVESGLQTEGRPRFPLLFKLLDANRTLSVQVHPNDAQGAELDPPDLGKTEAWVVLAAEPGSKIYAGLREGVDRDVLAAALQAGACDECLHVIEPEVGDCVFIPAGTVHALGEGLVIGEIQQASNTTFRLFDWNRVGKDGKARQLHIEESLAVTDYQQGPVQPQTPAELSPGADRPGVDRPGVDRLVECDKFVLDRRRLGGEGAATAALPADDRFRILCNVVGETTLSWESTTLSLPAGATALVPAACAGAELSCDGEATLLEMYLPS